MAPKGMTMGFLTEGPEFKAPSSHDALVAKFRAKLAGVDSPLDRVPVEQLEEARREFRELPEVAGQSLSAQAVGLKRLYRHYASKRRYRQTHSRLHLQSYENVDRAASIREALRKIAGKQLTY